MQARDPEALSPTDSPGEDPEQVTQILRTRQAPNPPERGAGGCRGPEGR